MDYYGTTAGFRAYHAARGNDVPAEAIDDDTVLEWLLVASEWLDARYAFPGLKIGQREQVRDWPRHSAFDRYGYAIVGIPREVENATYEIALRQGTVPGSLTLDYSPSKYKSVSIDGAISVTYANYSSAMDVQTHFGIVGQILAPILTSSGGGSAYSGAINRV